MLPGGPYAGYTKCYGDVAFGKAPFKEQFYSIGNVFKNNYCAGAQVGVAVGAYDHDIEAFNASYSAHVRSANSGVLHTIIENNVFTKIYGTQQRPYLSLAASVYANWSLFRNNTLSYTPIIDYFMPEKTHQVLLVGTGISDSYNDLTQITGQLTLKQVDSDSSVVCGVNGSNNIYCADQNMDSTPIWRQIKGKKLTQVAISNRRLFGVDSNYNIFYSPDYRKTQWTQLGGQLKQIAVDGSVICGVNVNNDIYCTDQINGNNPNWQQVAGKLKSVAIDNGRLYGVNTNNDLFYAPNYKKAQWNMLRVKLKQVSVDGSLLCGINQSNNILCGDHKLGSTLKIMQIPGSLTQVTVNSGRLYGVDSSNNIFYFPKTAK
jgi:Tectonin domain